MTTPVVPVNVINWPTLSIPADGEAVSSASVLLYIQEIANRLESIRTRVAGLNVPGAPIQSPFTVATAAPTTNWLPNMVTPTLLCQQNQVLGTSILFPLNRIIQVSACIIRDVTVFYAGAGAHAALPAVMPKLELIKQGRGTGGVPTAAPAPTVVATANDNSPNTAAFQNIHGFDLGALAESFDASVEYYLRVTAESGANALTAATVYSGYVTISGF